MKINTFNRRVSRIVQLSEIPPADPAAVALVAADRQAAQDTAAARTSIEREHCGTPTTLADIDPPPGVLLQSDGVRLFIRFWKVQPRAVTAIVRNAGWKWHPANQAWGRKNSAIAREKLARVVADLKEVLNA